MPRATAKIRKRFDEATEILHCELEYTLRDGQGIIGHCLELRTLEDWKIIWEKWRGVILPKVIEYLPGTRPFACYVVGEIPEREVRIEPPLTNDFLKLYIPSRDGTGQWHYRYPEPYMRAEHLHLSDLGIMDAAEMKRYRSRQRKLSDRGFYEDEYPLEQGLYR